MNPNVDLYLAEGCGRCSYHATPKCKVHRWKDELQLLRQLALASGLEETVKWGVPCYTYKNKNIINVSAFKEYCVISFFKGVLLKDENQILAKHGESSQSVRTLKFTNTDSIQKLETTIKEYIFGAIEIEKSGEKVLFQKNLEPIPEELTQSFLDYPDLETAFYALTPSRQRGYILHFSQAKQSHTRMDRIEKCLTKIRNGEGLNDLYKG